MARLSLVLGCAGLVFIVCSLAAQWHMRQEHSQQKCACTCEPGAAKELSTSSAGSRLIMLPDLPRMAREIRKLRAERTFKEIN